MRTNLVGQRSFCDFSRNPWIIPPGVFFGGRSSIEFNCDASPRGGRGGAREGPPMSGSHAGAYAGDIDVRTAWADLANKAEATLIDVRTKAEWSYVCLLYTSDAADDL